MKLFIVLGAINAGLSVAMGAFGAHGLEGKMDQYYLDIWEKAVKYQMYHALGLLVVGVLAGKYPASSLINSAGWFLFAGIVIFSGSLYVLSLTQISKLGMITPIGGFAFIIGWILLMVAAIKQM